MKNLLSLFSLLPIFQVAFTQNNVGIGIATPDASAALEISSTDQGVLIPRLSDTSVVTTPATGLLVYWNAQSSFWYYDGTKWNKIGAGSSGGSGGSGSGWELSGNGGTTAGTNFIGTTDNTDLSIKTNNTERLRITGHTIETLNNGQSVFIGEEAGINDDETSNSNVYVGNKAGKENVSGKENIGIGFESLRDATAANTNVGIGAYTLQINSTGRRNTALGFASMNLNTTGSDNVAVGQWSLNSNGAGTKNVALGYSSGFANTGSGNVFIGYSAGVDATTENDKLYIETSSNANTLIYGDFSTDRVGINWDYNVAMTQSLNVNGDAFKSAGGNMWSTSDKRLKTDITQLESEEILQKIKKLNGITYYWNDNKTSLIRPTVKQYGFTAQNLEEVFPELVKTDDFGYLMTQYGSLDAMIIEAIKALSEKVDALEKENKKLLKQINR